MGLEVSNLSKSFYNNKVLDNLSFKLDNPGVFGLLGSNGAGKTTTIRILLGILTKDSGSIKFDDKMLSRKRLSFGYMPEDRGVYPKSTVRNQLIYFGMLKGLSFSEAKQATEIWCEKLRVLEYLNRPAEQLSKGNQQKIQIISAILHSPKLLILDEPFSGLDPVNVQIIKNIIGELVNKGTYIILSTHQMTTVEEYCKEILILDEGKTVLKGNLDDIKNNFGENNLIIQTNSDISKLITSNMRLINKNVNSYEFKLNSISQANLFLKKLVDNNILLDKFEIKKPSLQEIFIRKVGI